MAQAVSNREKGVLTQLAFIISQQKDLMKNKGLTLDFDCDLSNMKGRKC